MSEETGVIYGNAEHANFRRVAIILHTFFSVHNLLTISQRVYKLLVGETSDRRTDLNCSVHKIKPPLQQILTLQLNDFKHLNNKIQISFLVINKSVSIKLINSFQQRLRYAYLSSSGKHNL